MEVREKSALAGDQFIERLIHLDAVERRKPQPLKPWLGREEALRKRSDGALVIGDIDAGQHDLLCAAIDLARYGIADQLEGKRSAGSARLPDRAEGAPMVATRLDRNEASHVALESSWRHDVIHCEAIDLVRVSNDSRDLRHGLERLRIKLGSTTCDQDLRRWPTPAGIPDRLSSLADRLVGDGAAVDDDPVFARRRGMGDRFALGEIEPAYQSHRLYTHATASRSSSLSNTCVALPRIRMAAPGSHEIVSEPPGMITLTGEVARLVLIAATAVAQAPVPQASVSPAPRSNVLR